MKKLLFIIAAFLMAALNAAHAAAPANHKKVALIIGNSNYTFAVTLPNPARDAALMAGTLRTAGFTVIEGTNLDKVGMGKVIDQFTEAAYDADVALIYYAGHGLQVDGQNYLIPVDAQLEKAAQLQTRTISVNDLMAALPPDPAVSLVILDACRDNPLARTLAAALPKSRSSSMGSGLAAVQANGLSHDAGGLLIAYATDPGSVAYDGSNENSPYTTALAKHLTTPGLEIQSALTRVRAEVSEATGGAQRPWHNASLAREVFLGGEPVAAQTPASQETASQTTQPAEGGDVNWTVEQKLWEEASKRNTIAHYELYLSQYPNGRFITLARLNLDQLKQSGVQDQVASLEVNTGTPTSSSASQVRTAVTLPDDVKQTPGTTETEALLNLDREARIDLQLRLSALGLDTGGFDGSIGPRSRIAIAAWQKRSGIVETTFLTQQQHMFLVVESDPLMVAVRAKYESDKKAAQKRQQAEKQKVATEKKAAKKSTQTANTTTKKKTTAKQQQQAADDVPYKPRHGSGGQQGGNSDAGAFAAGALFGTALGVMIKR